MKKLSKLFSVLLALTMALALAAPAFAYDIEVAEGSTRTYDVYQVFTGNLSADEKTLSNIVWGKSVKDGVTENASDVAATLAATNIEGMSEAEAATAVANVITPYVDIGNPEKRYGTLESGKELTGAPAGYYLFVDTTTNLGEGETKSFYMVKVVDDVEIAPKSSTVTSDKGIVETNEDGTETVVDANNAAIGQEITFELKGTTPDNYSSYNTYAFEFVDTLSSGLTYTKDSVEVYVGSVDDDHKLTTSDYTVSEPTETSNVLTVTLSDMKKITAIGNETTIYVRYKASLNENAVVGSTGNVNSLELNYTNNPNCTGEGESGYLDGTTPESKTLTFATEIKLTKVDGTTGTALEGAQFTIKGVKVETVYVTGEEFVANADGEYYKLEDGTYTKTAPTSNTTNLYEDATQRYSLTSFTKAVKVENEVSEIVTSGSDGVIKFTGLAEGTYTITEVAAPDGYNLLENPIEITIDWDEPDTGVETCTWSVNKESGAEVENGIVTLSINNEQGTVLPSTGGIGTTIFYVIGGVLVIGAGIALITKKRMNAKN